MSDDEYEECRLFVERLKSNLEFARKWIRPLLDGTHPGGDQDKVAGNLPFEGEQKRPE